MMTKLFAVLDASALLAYIKGEKGSDIVEDIIDKSIMSTINLTETIIVLGRINPDKLEYYQMAVNELVVHKHEPDNSLMFITSEIAVKYRKEHNLSLGDCYCLALGKYLSLPVYTADHHWLGMESKIDVTLKLIR